MGERDWTWPGKPSRKCAQWTIKTRKRSDTELATKSSLVLRQGDRRKFKAIRLWHEFQTLRDYVWLETPSYTDDFTNAPFPTDQEKESFLASLDAWFAALCRAMNKGACSPCCVAKVLQFPCAKPGARQ